MSTYRLLVPLLVFGVVSVFFTVQSAHGDAKYIDCELVLKMAEGNPVETITDQYNMTVVRFLEQIDVYLVATDEGIDLDQLSQTIEDMPEVEFCHPNYMIDHLQPVQMSLPVSDEANSEMYHSQVVAGSLDLTAVHTIATGEDVRVAILDGGVDYTHEALAGYVTSGHDWVGDDDDAMDDPGGSNSGHGTFLAGVIHLVAPEAEILAYRVADTNGLSNGYVVAEAIVQAVADGCRVINLSLVMVADGTHEAIGEAIHLARISDVVVISAAGNDQDGMVYYPASDCYSIAVAAVDSLNLLADFSSYGEHIDICAPGTAICAPYVDDGYVFWGGTSFAAPFVAGQAALVASMSPNLSWYDIMYALVESADPIDSINGTYSGLLGYGLLNLLEALASENSLSGDVDVDGQVDVNDLMPMVNFLYTDPSISIPAWVMDCDQIEGVTNNDLASLVGWLFHMCGEPSCNIVPDSAFSASQDTVRLVGTEIRPGAEMLTMELYIQHTIPAVGFSLALEYSCPTSAVQLTSVDWHTESSIQPWTMTDTSVGVAVLGLCEFYGEIQGESHLATLHFAIDRAEQAQTMHVSLASHGVSDHTTVLSLKDNGVVRGVVPTLVVMDQWPTLDLNGNCCLGSRRGNVNNDLRDNVDISDLVAMVNHLFVTLEPLSCYGEADLAPSGTPDGVVDITDLAAFAEYLFGDMESLGSCIE